MKYKAIHLGNYRGVNGIERLSKQQLEAIEVVGRVLPFRTNNYVTEQLINWDRAEEDPMFRLTFPQPGMLSEKLFVRLKDYLLNDLDSPETHSLISFIRSGLNPHPAGQMELNTPMMNDEKLTGIQHKYKETVLFFPSQGQTCHAYCTFCFRWPQFVGVDEWKLASRQADLLVNYVKEHKEISDVLFTGGDPMIMKTSVIKSYIEPLLQENLEHLRTIRFGTKALAYWPYRFLTDPDADELIRLFELMVKSGLNVSIMAHFSHPVELGTPEVVSAIKRLLDAGVQIRTQSPVLKHINDDPALWAEMWRKQVDLGCIPYYMFVPRDTGAQEYFALTLEDSWKIFREAYQQVSGICRTVRGPSMSCTPGKIQLLGVTQAGGKEVFALRMLQGRNPDWVARPFFAEYDSNAVWFDELKPAFESDEEFFNELRQMETAE